MLGGVYLLAIRRTLAPESTSGRPAMLVSRLMRAASAAVPATRSQSTVPMVAALVGTAATAAWAAVLIARMDAALAHAASEDSGLGGWVAACSGMVLGSVIAGLLSS